MSVEAAAAHVADSVRGWDAGDFYDFAITAADSVLPVLGRVGLDDLRWDTAAANVGYWVRTSRTRQGIATRAVRLLAEFAFEQLDLQRLELIIATDNLASRRVAEEAGAVIEGFRSAGGRLEHDSCVYVLSRPAR
ncbi:MAG: GNAT family N-acetyltransferase [Chloroflexi bacterium]|nr:GNAT family N-acetyltransferase [Chloroflexota bacterium]